MINEGDSRLHMGMDSGVLQQRAKHDMLSIEEVRMGARKRPMRVVVVPSRRIVEHLEQDGLWGAYKSIARALEIETSGLGLKIQNMESVGRGHGRSDDGLLFMRYMRWVDLCRGRHYSPLMIRKMVLEGMTFEQLDKAFQFRNGTAKQNLWQCLPLWDCV